MLPVTTMYLPQYGGLVWQCTLVTVISNGWILSHDYLNGIPCFVLLNFKGVQLKCLIQFIIEYTIRWCPGQTPLPRRRFITHLPCEPQIYTQIMAGKGTRNRESICMSSYSNHALQGDSR